MTLDFWHVQGSLAATGHRLTSCPLAELMAETWRELPADSLPVTLSFL